MRDGNQKHVVILTRNPSFVRKPASNMPLIRRVYHNYPNFVDTEEKRFLVDRRQRQTCALLAKTGICFAAEGAAEFKLDARRRKGVARPVCPRL